MSSATLAGRLDYYEMTHDQRACCIAHPLSRRLMLAGPADDFQATELARTMEQVAGREQRALDRQGPALPLIAEAAAAALLGFLFGLLLAYLVELRRRYNAQWNW